MIANALPGSTVLQGLAVRGKTAQEDPDQTQEQVNEWLEGLGMNRANTEEATVLAAYEVIQQAMIDKDYRDAGSSFPGRYSLYPYVRKTADQGGILWRNCGRHPELLRLCDP